MNLTAEFLAALRRLSDDATDAYTQATTAINSNSDEDIRVLTACLNRLGTSMTRLDALHARIIELSREQ